MRLRHWIACITLVGASAACGDDDVAGGSGTDGETDSSAETEGGSNSNSNTDSDTANSDSDSAETGDGPSICEVAEDCDDGDPCTVDVCGEGGICGTM
ncbi:MAG: MSCRAMM family adhesin SdrC, partial [Nannocystaceae bacterium]|nr:MSCRAMM family adhesin SdrC [Nannocystaceae bacterium]